MGEHHKNKFGFLWLLFLLPVIGAIMAGIKKGAKGKHRGGMSLEILKRRYAKGEISKAEFEEKKSVLFDVSAWNDQPQAAAPAGAGA